MIRKKRDLDSALSFLRHQGPFDAHHIIERRLWSDGGYYIDNGVTVCGSCHMSCEQTMISVEQVREVAGIKNVVLPDQFYPDDRIDKWGNTVLPNGQRLKGELFFDPSVQKVLSEVIHLFGNHVKYGRTFHLPWSPGVMDDDKVNKDLSGLVNREVVVTAKLDGENTTMYSDGLHARSLEYKSRIDRDRIKALHSTIAHEIPEGWRICGENVWAEHSIKYVDLPSIFFVFSIWDECGKCLTWDETTLWCQLLNLEQVPVIWRGVFDEKRLRTTAPPSWCSAEAEGYVVRPAGNFLARDFRSLVFKWVRPGHVRTQAHWTRGIKPNGLKT